MSQHSSIEWTDATWNPVTGCSEVSPGCEHCYARTFAQRFAGVPGHYFERGFEVQLRPDKLGLPARWRAPRRVFVNSMSDLFHTDVPGDYIARVFAVMAATPRHTYQVLTKRHGRMRSLLTSPRFEAAVRAAVSAVSEVPVSGGELAAGWVWPLPNMWLGVSVEDQPRARLRVPALVATPATVRFLSCEPLLGPLDLGAWLPELDWVIVGGESGRGARPMHPGWPRALRDQCQSAAVAFLFKQWGEHAPVGDGESGETLRRVGKHRAGRVLDGRVWDQFPHPAVAGADGHGPGVQPGVHPCGVQLSNRAGVQRGAGCPTPDLPSQSGGTEPDRVVTSPAPSAHVERTILPRGRSSRSRAVVRTPPARLAGLTPQAFDRQPPNQMPRSTRTSSQDIRTAAVPTSRRSTRTPATRQQSRTETEPATRHQQHN